jgi:predicted AlkP superfamily phosphohydrolase/phosphomutase
MLLIGIDGATWKIIDKLLAEGELPALQSLIDRGVRAPLKTLEPTISPAIWTTIATGKLPDRHGILGFDGVPGLTMKTLPTSQMRKTKAVWNMFSDGGKTVGFINWWCSWPAEKVNGFIISDRATYNRMEASIKKEVATPYDTYPENLMTAITEFIEKPDAITNEAIKHFMVLNDSEIEKFIKTGSYQMGNLFLEFKYVYQSDKAVFSMGNHLLAERTPDLLGIYFSGVDVVSHLYWHFMEPEYFSKHAIPPAHIARFSKVIERYYVFIDQCIGELLKTAHDRYTIAIVSDHGFGATGNLPWSGGHGRITPGAPVAPNEIFIMSGKNIKKGERLTSAHILDILPTILHLFALPLGRDLEGKILFEALDERVQKEPMYIDSYDTNYPARKETPLRGDPERDSALVNKLKSLGYVE